MHVEQHPRERARKKLIFIGTTRLHFGYDGKIRSLNPVMASAEWAPFLDVFEEIEIITRIDQSFVSNDGYVLDNPRIKIRALPFYDGPLEFYKKKHKITRFVTKNVTDPTAVYLTWVPTGLALLVAKRAKQIGASLLVRVVGDGAEVIRSIVPPPVNVIWAKKTGYNARRAVQLADGIVYVTLNALQKLYPASRGAMTLARTNMNFPPELFEISKKNHQTQTASPYRIIAVGSQEQNYKGHDLLIKAIAGLQREGFNISLTLVGKGRLHGGLVQLAKTEGVDKIKFIKHLGTSIDVARYVSDFDMFIMPSRTEGMPKALMEAMSVGVLALGSSVGGILELLEQDCLFEPDSVTSIQRRIRQVINNPAMAAEQRHKQENMVQRIRTEHSGPTLLSRFLEEFVARQSTQDVG